MAVNEALEWKIEDLEWKIEALEWKIEPLKSWHCLRRYKL